MDTRTLVEITKTRLVCSAGNPTEYTYFAEVLRALQELDLRRALDVGYKPEKNDGSS